MAEKGAKAQFSIQVGGQEPGHYYSFRIEPDQLLDFERFAEGCIKPIWTDLMKRIADARGA